MKNKFAGLFLIFIGLFLTPIIIQAQEDLGNTRWGLQVGGGQPTFIPSYADFAPDYNGVYFYEFGLVYLYKLNDRWEFKSGLNYIANRFEVTPRLPQGSEPFMQNRNYFMVPLNFHYYLPHRFFAEFGTNLTQDTRESFGSLRLGYTLGVGKEFELSEKNGFLINLHFSRAPHFPTNTEGVLQLGIRGIFTFSSAK